MNGIGKSRTVLLLRHFGNLQAGHVVSRREAALAGMGALLLSPGAAQAGFLGGGPDKNEVYTQDTVSMQNVALLATSSCKILNNVTLQSLLLEKVKNGLDLPKDASNREEVFQEIKDKTTAWVAKYRRGAQFQGRPSYRSEFGIRCSSILCHQYNPCYLQWFISLCAFSHLCRTSVTAA